jgi:hypothetical protein
MATDVGDLVERAPVLYQDIDGERHTVEGGYAIRSDRTVGFRVGKYDAKYPLVIDPILSYSTYLGGSAQERANGVAIDAAGNIIVVGETYSTDFPMVNAASGDRGWGDVFVAKLTPSGDALIYATYLGGDTIDVAGGVDVDAGGNAYVVGSTWSWDFRRSMLPSRGITARATPSWPSWIPPAFSFIRRCSAAVSRTTRTPSQWTRKDARTSPAQRSRATSRP